MPNKCECCAIREKSNERYCSVCTRAHQRMLNGIAIDLAAKSRLPAPDTAAVLSAAIILRNLRDDEAAARDVLIRQIQGLETELEIERIQTLAKDFVDMQSYAQYLEKTYNHPKIDEDIKKSQRGITNH